jgi:hypothetical protein
VSREVREVVPAVVSQVVSQVGPFVVPFIVGFKVSFVVPLDEYSVAPQDVAPQATPICGFQVLHMASTDA